MERLLSENSESEQDSVHSVQRSFGIEKIDPYLHHIESDELILVAGARPKIRLSLGFTLIENLLQNEQTILWARSETNHSQAENQFKGYLQHDYFDYRESTKRYSESINVSFPGKLLYERIIPGQEQTFFESLKSTGDMLGIDLVIFSDIHSIVEHQSEENQGQKKTQLLRVSFEAIQQTNIPMVIMDNSLRNWNDQEKPYVLGDLHQYKQCVRYSSRILLLQLSMSEIPSDEITDIPMSIPLNKPGKTGKIELPYDAVTDHFIRNDQELAETMVKNRS